MGNCIKIRNNRLHEKLIDSNDTRGIENYEYYEEEFNKLYTQLSSLIKKYDSLETKISILENNTQHNIESISKDIHFINDKIKKDTKNKTKN